MGLLDADINSPEGQGLLQAAFSLMGAQKLPGQRGLGSALGEAGRQYLGASNQARDSQMRRLLAKSQIDENTAQAMQRTAAMEAMKRKREALPGLYGGATVGGGSVIGTPPVEGGQSSMQIDYLKALQAGYTPDEIQKMAELPNAGRAEVARTVEVMENGRPVTRQLDKFGQPIGGGLGVYKAPVFQNLGGRTVAIDPVSMREAGSFAQSMSPSERDASARGWAGVGLQRDAAQSGKAPSGYRFNAGGNLEAIPGGPADVKAGAEGAKRTSEAGDVLKILDQAEPLIDKSTASYTGAAADQAARAFGFGTPGANAAAQLKALEGALISKMPKMSGPQSDKDVLLYKQMAGQIGDPTIPASTRKAAVSVIRSLNERYAGVAPESTWTPNTKSSAITQGGWSATLKK